MDESPKPLKRDFIEIILNFPQEKIISVISSSINTYVNHEDIKEISEQQRLLYFKKIEENQFAKLTEEHLVGSFIRSIKNRLIDSYRKKNKESKEHKEFEKQYSDLQKNVSLYLLRKISWQKECLEEFYKVMSYPEKLFLKAQSDVLLPKYKMADSHKENHAKILYPLEEIVEKTNEYYFLNDLDQLSQSQVRTMRKRISNKLNLCVSEKKSQYEQAS